MQHSTRVIQVADVPFAAHTPSNNDSPAGVRVLQSIGPVLIIHHGSGLTTLYRFPHRWDVESVLSMRSNVEHHPARIVEPQKRAGSKGGESRMDARAGAGW